jgi:hypothetical protein
MHQPHRYKYLDYLINIFVVTLIISNLVAPKLCQLGPFKVSAALLLFPFTYIFGDIFTEVYGYGASRRAIWTGFSASALMSVIAIIVVKLPPAADWANQQAYELVLGFVPRIVVASLIAYWCGEFANAFVMARLKVATKGRMLWVRTIGSTAAGQLVDTVIVTTLVFLGSESLATIGELILNGYGFKVLYEAAMTPVTYWIVNALKKAEGVDVYDVDTNFNPFHSALR